MWHGPSCPPARHPLQRRRPSPGYDLLESLGEGGMGVVWKARQTKLNRLVALKMVLGEQRAGSKELIRFLAEAEAVAAVKHPHVVQVYEYGDANGRPFLAMEYLPGGSLADRLKRTGRLDPNAAAKLVETLAGAVQAAHEMGIVHRDLKPGNVLYDEHGEPKVTDFGLAKQAGAGDLTATQAVMGTPAYMAPEQARGDTKFVGPQGDVYSLGVILYEYLTGTRPFEATDQLALLRKVAEDEPERPRKRIAGIAPGRGADLPQVPGEGSCRPLSDGEGARGRPGRFAAGEPVSVRSAGVVERAAKWARRKPTLAAAYTLGLLAVLLGGLGGAAVWQWRAAERAQGEAEKQRDRANVARSEAETARGREATARAEAERQREKFERFDYGRTIQVAHQEWRDGNITAARTLLDGTRADLRGWEWRYVHRLCHSDLLTLEGHTGGVQRVSFSPDGSRVLTASLDKTAKVWDARSGALVCTLGGHTSGVNAASFSPDGLKVLTASLDKTAKVWDAKSGANIISLTGHTSALVGASFSPDGLRVLTVSYDKTARIWDAKSGAVLLKLEGHSSRVTRASFSPDGSRVLTAIDDNTAKVWDVKSGAVVFTFNGHTGHVSSASFSPDGSQVVTASDDNTAKIWDARSGSLVFTLKGHTEKVNSASFSPDGSRVLTSGYNNTVKVWDAKSGTEVLTLKGHADAVTETWFSPDGSRIITGSFDNTIKVWDATPINRKFLPRQITPPPRGGEVR